MMTPEQRRRLDATIEVLETLEDELGEELQEARKVVRTAKGAKRGAWTPALERVMFLSMQIGGLSAARRALEAV